MDKDSREAINVKKIYDDIYKLTDADASDGISLLLACLIKIIEDSLEYDKESVAKFCCDLIMKTIKQRKTK